MSFELEVLRPQSWVEERQCSAGNRVWIELDELSVKGWAFVQHIGPCPSIQRSEGRVVLGTVTHLNGYVLQIRLEGEKEPLEPMSLHPIYSLTRGDWVQAGKLKPGEVLKTRGGSTRIESIGQKPGVHRVYNLEVEGEHWYFAGGAEALCHNECPDAPEGLPDDANVVRGGQNRPEDIARGTGTHPSGVTGVPVKSAPGKSVAELSENIPKYGQVGTTTVGQVRAAGGDVIPTSGRSPNHATMTGLSPEAASDLLTPTIPNPARGPKP